jgi:hypothetical protein
MGFAIRMPILEKPILEYNHEAHEENQKPG